MQARTLLYKAMVLSPLGFIAWMGIQGRFSGDTFEFTACTANEQSAITGYIEPVQLMATMGEMRARKLSDDRLTELAAEWQRVANSGRLKPIRPAEFGTSIRDGVSAEILKAVRRYAEVESEIAFRASEREEYENAMDHLVLAYNGVRPTKYSDSISVSLLGVLQRDTLRSVRLLYPKTSPKRRTTLIADLTMMLTSQESLEPISRHNYAIYLAYLRTKEKPMETDTVPGTIVALAVSHPREADQGQNNREFHLAERSERILSEQIKSLRAEVRSSVVFDLKK